MFRDATHIDDLPDEICYIRTGYDQYWRDPKGGWWHTSYQDVLDTIERIEKVNSK